MLSRYAVVWLAYSPAYAFAICGDVDRWCTAARALPNCCLRPTQTRLFKLSRRSVPGRQNVQHGSILNLEPKRTHGGDRCLAEKEVSSSSPGG